MHAIDVLHLLTPVHRAALDSGRALAAALAMPTARRSVNSKRNGPPLAERGDGGASEQSAPHPPLAPQLHGQLAALQTRAEVAEAVLDSLAAGVFTLDATGRVLRTNRKAEAILHARDGLSLRNNRLRCAHRRDAARLDAAILRAINATTGSGADGGSVLSVLRPSLLRPFGVAVMPVRVHDASQGPLLGTDGAGGVAVLVIVSDPEHTPQISQEHLSQLFGLTPAEARLAAALATRETLEEYAEQAGISCGTARWTLKCVLEKTGCRRQSELILLLVTSVASMLGG
jgi:DNA-binding CsgD family transcriptional regulator